MKLLLRLMLQYHKILYGDILWDTLHVLQDPIPVEDAKAHSVMGIYNQFT